MYIILYYFIYTQNLFTVSTHAHYVNISLYFGCGCLTALNINNNISKAVLQRCAVPLISDVQFYIPLFNQVSIKQKTNQASDTYIECASRNLQTSVQ